MSRADLVTLAAARKMGCLGVLMRGIVKRRIALMLTGVVGLAIVVLPQAGFTQSDPFVGTWLLNLARSKFSPGPPPGSGTVDIQAEGQNLKVTFTGTGTDGNPINTVTILVFDEVVHPAPGHPNFDARADMRVDANTVITSRIKAGKLVQTQTDTISLDSRTLTITTIGIDRNGRPTTSIVIAEKQ
jgi:hypothetical protein